MLTKISSHIVHRLDIEKQKAAKDYNKDQKGKKKKTIRDCKINVDFIEHKLSKLFEMRKSL
jgi:hypothetical protein